MNSLLESNKGLIINGWLLLAHALFLDQLEKLVEEVENNRRKNPLTFKEKNCMKRLAAVKKLITEKIPQDPTATEFRQGIALGEKYKHWFRAKFFQRYRLFFRYHAESKIIIYGWMNDEKTKRAYESHSDAYLTFKKMLQKGCPPDSWSMLLNEAKKEILRFSLAFSPSAAYGEIK